MYARIWIEPGGGVKITTLTPGADMGKVTQVLKDDGHVHKASQFLDFEDEAALRAVLPADRTLRYKWRKHPTQDRIVVDPTVPDRVDPGPPSP